MAVVFTPVWLSGNRTQALPPRIAVSQLQRVSVAAAPRRPSVSRKVSLPSKQMTGARHCGEGTTPVCPSPASPATMGHCFGSSNNAATSAKKGVQLPRAATMASLSASPAGSGEAVKTTSIGAESCVVSRQSPDPDEASLSPRTDSTATQALAHAGRLLLAAAMTPGPSGLTASDPQPSPGRTVGQGTPKWSPYAVGASTVSDGAETLSTAASDSAGVSASDPQPSPGRTVGQGTPKCSPYAVGVSAVSDGADTLSTAASDSESVCKGTSPPLQRICVLDADLTLFVSHQQVYFGTVQEAPQHAALNRLLRSTGSATIVRDFLGDPTRCAAVREALDHFRRDGASRVVIVSHSHRSVLMRLLEIMDLKDLVDDVLGRAEMASRGTPSKTDIALQLGVEAGVAGKSLAVVEDNPAEVADAQSKGLSSLRAGSDANPWTGLTEEQLRRLGAGEFD